MKLPHCVDPSTPIRPIAIASGSIASGHFLLLHSLLDIRYSEVFSSFGLGSRERLREVEQLMVQEQQQQLDGLANSIDAPGVPITTRVLLGDPVDAVIRAVMTGEFGFLIKQPAPSRGLRQQIFGSVDTRLLRACPSPVTSDRADRFRPKLELLRSDPTVVIPQRVKELDADLLSIGTVSRTGLSGWLIGNTAAAILSRIDCSATTLKPEGLASPLSAT